MAVEEGLIWTYYNCSDICYLFGKFELPCVFMNLSYSLFTIILIWIILFYMHKLANKKDKVKLELNLEGGIKHGNQKQI